MIDPSYRKEHVTSAGSSKLQQSRPRNPKAVKTGEPVVSFAAQFAKAAPKATPASDPTPAKASTPAVAPQARLNPFSGVLNPTQPAPVYSAPEIAAPPPMTSRPPSISLGTTSDAAIFNSARSVQMSNFKYNEQAFESYNKAVGEWQANSGRRWIGNNQFAQTSEPPPPPVYLTVDFGEIYADIATHYLNGRPDVDVNATRPYYMGGSIFSAPKAS